MKYLLDSHTHTTVSGHAYNTLNEMVQAAKEQGLEALGITEHAPNMPGSCHYFHFANLRVLPRKIQGIEVFFGSELNIMDFDGTVDLPQSLLGDLDVVIASLHIPCFKSGTAEENTRACLKAMENPYVNILGHPDDGRYPLIYEPLVQSAKEHGVLLEVNNSSLRPIAARMNARENYMEMLELCKQYQAPIILNSDAHCMWDVGAHESSEALLKEVDFPEELVVNRSVEEYKKYINRFKYEKTLYNVKV